MPTYDFRCGKCGRMEEDFLSLPEARAGRTCACGGRMTICYTAMNFISSEFKSIRAWDPKLKHDVSTHGDHFDLGLGCWVKDKNDRARIMRSKGLKEVGKDWDKALNLKGVEEERHAGR